MIEMKEIQTATAKVLTKSGYTVIAAEVKEGFPKPACFIEIMPVSVVVENQFAERVTVSVEITYHPAIETREELIKQAKEFKSLFLYTPIKVRDRYLSVNEISFDTDKSALLVYFELEFLQETETKTTRISKMKNLYERVVTESGGTSKDTD